MTPEQKALQEAIEIAGGQSELARKLSSDTHGHIRQQQVWNWLHREKRTPSKHAIFIEKITGISKKRLRPDIFVSE